MSRPHDSMMDPQVETLLDRFDTRFRLVTVAARRARQITDYYGRLGEGLGSLVPPQVTTTARKPLSIAFEELAVDKITYVPIDPDAAADLELVEGVEDAVELDQAIEGDGTDA